MEFLNKFFWEFIQNLPLIAGLMLALQLWQDTLLLPSIIIGVTGSLLGALLIRITERKIVGDNRAGLQGTREPIAVTIINFVLMFIFMMGLAIYLSAFWSNMLTDLLVGTLIGVILSAGQSKAAGEAIAWRHSIAFAVAFPAALITIRFLSAVLPLTISILLINTIVTLIITYIDYDNLATIKEGVN